MSKYSVDIVIPTFAPDDKLARLINSLASQTVQPQNIFIINTLSDNNATIKNYPNPHIHITNIPKGSFDHGATRNYGASLSKAETIIFMTQDAVPADNKLIENLCHTLFSGHDIAIAYARQIAYSEHGIIEKFTREYNYPSQDQLKNTSAKKSLGIKTYFCSNVCAAYKREYFEQLGGFNEGMIFNEDMAFAAKAINSGYSVYYASGAMVFHSHKYELKKLFSRHFDLGVSQKENEDIFNEFSSEKEGVKFARYVIFNLKKRKKYLEIANFSVQCIAKYCGHLLGKHYTILPFSLITRISMNNSYWKKNRRRK